MENFGIDTILRALDISLDRRKAGFAIAGLFVSTLVAGLFFYIAIEAGSGFITVLFGLLGVIASWVLSTLVTGTLARMSYNELSTGRTLGWRPALAYSRGHLGTLIFSPLALGVGILLALLVQLILLFLGRIPYLGELWVAVLFLPLVVINLFIILLAYLGGWLIPAVVAAEGRGIADTLRRVQQMVRRAPGRILAYLSIAVILGLLAALIIVPLVYSAVVSTAGLTVLALGEGRLAEFSRAIPGVSDLFFLPSPFGLSPWLTYGTGGVPITMRLAGFILTVTVLLIPVVVFAELFIVFPIACGCATYLSVMGETVAPGTMQPRQARPPGPAFCIRCGAELPPGTRFCLQCGAPQDRG